MNKPIHVQQWQRINGDVQRAGNRGDNNRDEDDLAAAKAVNNIASELVAKPAAVSEA